MNCLIQHTRFISITLDRSVGTNISCWKQRLKFEKHMENSKISRVLQQLNFLNQAETVESLNE